MKGFPRRVSLVELYRVGKKHTDGESPLFLGQIHYNVNGLKTKICGKYTVSSSQEFENKAARLKYILLN